MYAYYTAARWFGLAIDVIILVFLTIVSTTELYLVTDSSSAGKCNENNLLSRGFHSPLGDSEEYSE
jgi:hypothetical protein